MTDTPYAPEYEGTTYNGRPVLSIGGFAEDSEGEHSDMEVRCLRGQLTRQDRLNPHVEGDCEWSGEARELIRGGAKGGSQPRDLLCPECKWRLAAERGTTGAGYWDGKIP